MPDFQTDVIDRLARIETNQTNTLTLVAAHHVRITRVESHLGRVMASVAFIGTCAGVLGHWVLGKLGLV